MLSDSTTVASSTVASLAGRDATGLASITHGRAAGRRSASELQNEKHQIRDPCEREREGKKNTPRTRAARVAPRPSDMENSRRSMAPLPSASKMHHTAPNVSAIVAILAKSPPRPKVLLESREKEDIYIPGARAREQKEKSRLFSKRKKSVFFFVSKPTPPKTRKTRTPCVESCRLDERAMQFGFVERSVAV